jgi:hypothetical protein
LHIIVTIYQTECGISLNRTSLAEKGLGEEKLVITDCLSMQCSGFYAQVLHGVIYLQIMAVGKTLTVVFVAGATKEYGRIFWSSWLSNLTTNG